MLVKLSELICDCLIAYHHVWMPQVLDTMSIYILWYHQISWSQHMQLCTSISGALQNCSISILNPLKLPQSCTKPSVSIYIYYTHGTLFALGLSSLLLKCACLECDMDQSLNKEIISYAVNRGIPNNKAPRSHVYQASIDMPLQTLVLITGFRDRTLCHILQHIHIWNHDNSKH